MAKPKELKVTLDQEQARPAQEPQGLCCRSGPAKDPSDGDGDQDTPENRGMINRVSYLLSVEEA